MAQAETATKNLASSIIYDRATGVSWEATDSTWEEVKAKGSVQLNIPVDKSIIGLQHFRAPGGTSPTGVPTEVPPLGNSTGYINFFSPFWYRSSLATDITRGAYKGKSAGWRTAVAAYVPVREGYEEFFNDGTGFTLDSIFTGFKAPGTVGGNRLGSGRTYKLQFLTNKARNRAHTCQDNVAMIKDQFVQKAYINPVTAAERGIKDGDMVYVYNERGCTYLPACVTHYIVPGIVSIEHGSWYRAHPTEKVTVYLTSMTTGDVTVKSVPVDVGGSENVLTDDSFIYDVHYVNQTGGLHGGPCEVSLRKPE
jgi:anaerobic dimethyl sulfoxide reductase subunit A